MSKFNFINVPVSNTKDLDDEGKKSEEPKKPVDIVRGFHQYINFGKHKGKTFYDVANEQDWKYLMWCDRAAGSITNQKPLDNGSIFRIDESCRCHIHAALRSKNQGGIWVEHDKKSSTEEDTDLVFYMTDTGLAGPEIKYRRCSMCRRRKNAAVVHKKGPNTRLCDMCIREVS